MRMMAKERREVQRVVLATRGRDLPEQLKRKQKMFESW
jgi:hypothetical protein